MRIAFIILAYKNPTQLRILIEHLIHPEHFFFIHIDKRVNISPFKEELEKWKDKIFWIKREISYWGSYQCVKAVVNGLSQAMNHENVRFDYFIHLSGQDFPLKSPDFIDQTLSRHFPKSFINLIPFPVQNWENGGFDRLRQIKFFWKGKRIILHPGIRNLVLKALFSFLSGVFKLLDRNRKFYGGEFYFMLHRSGVERLLTNISKYPLFFRRLKYVTLPEEIMIHTMLMMDNETDPLIISEDSFRFIDWSTNEKGPKEMGEHEIWDLLKSPYLFGRKFTISNPLLKVNFNE